MLKNEVKILLAHKGEHMQNAQTHGSEQTNFRHVPTAIQSQVLTN